MSSKPSDSSTPSPRICVVGGGGRWGSNHVRTLVKIGALAGVAEVDPGRRAAVAQKWPEIALFESHVDAAAAGFDGFVVATPAHTHYEVARFLLEKGCHVLVEKPITLVTEEARDLCRLARERGANLMVGHVLLFHPAIREMKRLIDSGKIGRLQYLYSNRLNLGTVRTEENILWSFAPHDISIFQYLIGTRPKTIESRGGVFLQPEIHDTTMTLLRYPENIVAHIFLSWLHPYKEHKLVVVGSKGMLSFDDSKADSVLSFYEKGIDWVAGEPIKRDGPTEIIDVESELPLTAELRYFADHLDGKPLAIASGESGLEILEILERATADMLGATRESPVPAARLTINPYFVHPTAVIDDNVAIGNGSKIWHFCHIQSNARIGERTSLGQNVYVGRAAVIGSHVKIQNNVSVYEGVELEDYVFCGPSMVFTNVLDPRSKFPRKSGDQFSRTLVREGATLGANCTVVCGNTIGRHAFVAAGAVVTKDVPDYALMAGVPARHAGWVCECGERLDGEKFITCSRCEREYLLEDAILRRTGSNQP